MLVPVPHLNELDKGVVDTGTVREPETGSRAEFVEEEEFLFSPDLAVVTLGGLLEELLVLCHLFRVGEGDAVDSLEGVVVLVAQKVRRRVFQDRHRLDLACVWDVRTAAKIDEGPASINCGGGAVGNLCADKVPLVLVVLRGGDGERGRGSTVVQSRMVSPLIQSFPLLPVSTTDGVANRWR